MEIIQIRNIKQASGFPLLLKATTSKRQFIYDLGVQVCNMIFNNETFMLSRAILFGVL